MEGGPERGNDVARAIAVLEGGGLVAFPTETVYGLGADASSDAAVAKVFAAKGRPRAHPLIVHLAEGAPLDGWAIDVPEVARQLARAAWPGPLTMILLRGPRVAAAVTGGGGTGGVCGRGRARRGGARRGSRGGRRRACAGRPGGGAGAGGGVRGVATVAGARASPARRSARDRARAVCGAARSRCGGVRCGDRRVAT